MTIVETGAPAPPPEEDEGRLELLTFRCGDRSYAVDIMDVREIRGWSRPTPLPHAPAHMLGMVNLRGSVLPVMDLSRRLGAGTTPENPRNVIIVMTSGGSVQGCLVDAVSDIVQPRVADLQDVPRTGEREEVVGDKLFVLDDVMVQVLSTERVLSLPSRAAVDAR